MAIIEQSGIFWWNDEVVPERQFAALRSANGILIIDDDGRCNLEIHGIIPRHERSEIDFFVSAFEGTGTPPFGAIQGLLKGSNQYILLLDVLRNGASINSNNLHIEKFISFRTLVSRYQFAPGATASATSIRINITGLHEWLDLSNIEIESSQKKITARYAAPEKLEYRTNWGFVNIDFSATFPIFSQRTHIAEIREYASFNIIFCEPKTLKDTIIECDFVNDFLLLLADSHYEEDWPIIEINGKDATFYYPKINRKHPSRSPDLLYFWASFAQVKGNFGQIWEAWRSNRDLYGSGYYLFLSVKRRSDIYAEHRFVNLIWGFESIHRKQNGEYKSPEQLRKKIEHILDSIQDTKDRKWLEKKLKYAAEPALEQRIREVCEKIPIRFERQSLLRFATKCATLRNEISHFGGPNGKRKYEDFFDEVTKYTDALMIIYHIFILYEIGIDKEIIIYRIKEGPKAFEIQSAFHEGGLVVEWEPK